MRLRFPNWTRFTSAISARECATQDGSLRFEFETRNRRPATDPVNAMLSFTYAMLVREWTATLSAIGFDPYRGFYHQPRYGRPALALDMMEPFSPDSPDEMASCALSAPISVVRSSLYAGSGNLSPDGPDG